jgi:K+-transporting ATPase ATPase C chain
LTDEVNARIAALKASDPLNTAPIPVDLVTASGSGLDPNISIAAALYQVPRVSKARMLSEEVVKSLVDRYTKERQFIIFGEPRVNVLELNMALDGIK